MVLWLDVPGLDVPGLDMPVWACAGRQNKAAPVARAATVTNREIIAHLIRSHAREPERRRAAAAGRLINE
jgi:hypothetical protein